MLTTLDLQVWNTRGQDGAKEAGVTRSVAALGAKLDELRRTEANPKTERAEPQERNPTMAQETQRARAAAAGAAGSTFTETFSKAAIPDAPKHASESRNDYELVLGRGQIASCLFAGTVVVAIFAGGAYFAGKLSAMNCVAASNSIPQAAAPLRVPSVISQENVSEAGVPNTNVPPAGASQADPSQPRAAAQTGIASAATKTAIVPFTLDAAGATPNSANVPKEVATAASGAPAPKTNANAQAHASQTSAAALPDERDAKGAPLFANPQRGVLYLQVGAVDRGMATIIAEGLRQHGLVSFVAPGPSDKIFRVLVGPLANQDEYKRVKGQVDSIDVGNFAREFEK